MILITGSSGCVGWHLKDLAKQAWTPDRKELDLENPKEVFQKVMDARPDLIFHLAALTDVDLCQRDQQKAATVNWLATRAIAKAAAQLNATVVYLSTDYVFSGDDPPYMEYHQPQPVNFYGLSKLMGERELMGWHKAYIIRTSWVFGPRGRNFLSRFLDLAQQRVQIKAISDHFSTPTYAPWLAERLWSIASESVPPGLYHLAGQTSASYLEFVVAGLEFLGTDSQVIPVSGEDMDRPAPRPRDSSLASWAWKRAGGEPIPGWKQGLLEFVKWWKTSREQ